jgi:hypothetical protein
LSNRIKGSALRRRKRNDDSKRNWERVQARLDVLYEDRLDGRIDAATYDRKAAEIREQQDRIRQKIRAAEAAALAPISEAVDLVALTSKAADLLLAGCGKTPFFGRFCNFHYAESKADYS